MSVRVFLPPVVKGYPRPNYHGFVERGFRELGARVIPSPHQPVVSPVMAIDIERGDRRMRAWWDWSDFARMNTTVGTPYFKIELREQTRIPGVYPTGQVVYQDLLNNLAALREAAASREYGYDVFGIFRITNYDDRRKLVETIRAQPWKSYCGLASSTNRPPIPADLAIEKIPAEENYRLSGTAKICIAPPGCGEKTVRHMEVLALGSCLVMPETTCVWPADYAGCLVTCKRDWSDLPDLIDNLLANDGERLAIARAGMDYWDKWLSPKATARIIYEATFNEEWRP